MRAAQRVTCPGRETAIKKARMVPCQAKSWGVNTSMGALLEHSGNAVSGMNGLDSLGEERRDGEHREFIQALARSDRHGIGDSDRSNLWSGQPFNGASG